MTKLCKLQVNYLALRCRNKLSKRLWQCLTILTLDTFLLGYCTKFSFTQINEARSWLKWLYPPFTPFAQFPPTNWPIEVNIIKLNWRQIFVCQYIHVYTISIIIKAAMMAFNYFDPYKLSGYCPRNLKG